MSMNTTSNAGVTYFYNTARGKATLQKGDDKPLKQLGVFKTEAEALTACKQHFAQACRAATNLGVKAPTAFFL